MAWLSLLGSMDSILVFRLQTPKGIFNIQIVQFSQLNILQK